MVARPLTEKIPDHLRPFITQQDASLYTPIDHAAWRFILRISKAYFSAKAHPKYLQGLEETGISSDRIPLISEMDQKLRQFGWRAVPVSGFIPPAAFMEFQSLGILPIACEMRTLDHLAYTPAPDIVHEAAGHAPILADPEYAEYLRHYGEVSRKAIFSKQDMNLYQAIRDLSEIKEDASSTPDTIAGAQDRLDAAVARTSYISEATYLARMNWWTVEYGLVGSSAEPKIYGAGLLSSVGESYGCLLPEVRKIPFTEDCVNVSYDITQQQPQLFVTEDFTQLTQVLNEFASTMAYHRGGLIGLSKAKMAETVTTTVLDSGLQVSGVLVDLRLDASGEPCFLKYGGPCQLATNDEELENQGVTFHPDGFSTPIGNLKGLAKPVSLLSDAELTGLGFSHGRSGRMEFESGIVVEGALMAQTERAGFKTVLRFNACTIRWGEEILYQPEWGTFDLACGQRVVSVFGGPADRSRFATAPGGQAKATRAPKSNLTVENQELNALYAEVKALREVDVSMSSAEIANALTRVHARLETEFPDDWLLRLELLELDAQYGFESHWKTLLNKRLVEIAASRNDRGEMIARGLELMS